MYISKVPTKVTDLLALPDPAPDTVKELASQQMSINHKETFQEFPHPTALDKMLLPATPQLDSSTVEGNKEKELKINQDEKMELAIDLQRLTNQKV